MKYKNETMETRDADLGYIKGHYIPSIHNFLINGGTLTDEQSLSIKEVHETFQSIFASVTLKGEKNGTSDL